MSGTPPERIETEALALLRSGAPPESVSAAWPAIGRRVERDGRVLREVTFVTTAPAGVEAMIHLNGVTDGHRTDIRPAIFERIAKTSTLALAYLLPDDLIASYRIVADPDLPRDAGVTRDGWLRIHRLGMPDPRNPRTLPNPLGSRSSVLVLPGAREHPAWDAGNPRVRAVARHEHPSPHGSLVTLVPEEAAGLLVLFDGENWDRSGIEAALGRRTTATPAVVLVPSGTLARRRELLPHPERIAAHLADDVLPAVAAAAIGAVAAVLGGRPSAARTIVAGESFGGLAAASIVALRPDLASVAIAQSGSYHFRADTELERPTATGGRAGDLIDALHDARVSGRFELTAGTQETGMLALSERFAEAVTSAGGTAAVRAYAGGHDYAWWRTGLFDALDRLA